MHHSKKSSIKKRDRKLARGSQAPSPTKTVLLELPLKETTSIPPKQPVRKSPKRRPIQKHTIMSSSSSTESLTSSTKGNYYSFINSNNGFFGFSILHYLLFTIYFIIYYFFLSSIWNIFEGKIDKTIRIYIRKGIL